MDETICNSCRPLPLLIAGLQLSCIKQENTTATRCFIFLCKKAMFKRSDTCAEWFFSRHTVTFLFEQLIDEFLQAAKIILCNLKWICFELFEQNLPKNCCLPPNVFFKNMSTLTDALNRRRTKSRGAINAQWFQ